MAEAIVLQMHHGNKESKHPKDKEETPTMIVHM